MIMKWLYRKKLVANISNQIFFTHEHLSKLQHILLQEDEQMRLMFAKSVSSLVSDTAAKYRISQKSALYGDTLTWRQLGNAIDDWNIAIESAERLSQSAISLAARSYGLCTGHAIVLYINIYQMKFNQQQFPELLGEEVSCLLRTCTRLSELLCNLVNGVDTDEQLLLFIRTLD